MGNTNSTLDTRANGQLLEEENFSMDIPTITETNSSNSSLVSLDSNKKHPTDEKPITPHFDWPPPLTQDDVFTAAQAVPVSGWVSSSGNASPWYGSLSSSGHSNRQHRASISGPYYRTRGMSVSRDEVDEDLSLPPSQLQAVASSSTPPNPNIVTSQEGVPTIITWTQGGNNVYITGTFNGWKHKIKLVKSTHDFSIVLDLPPGTHRLKFIVDDEWKCSNDMETATEADGNLVNYLLVMDENEENMEGFGEDDRSSVSSFGSSDSLEDKRYTNEIPTELLQITSALSVEPKDEQQKKALAEWKKKQPQPPALPPHLDKVLLNSHTVSEEDNSVLHEPNHVTLNHLYACSIKDNVMALATTSRYRKKYVTTMYYRPVFPKQ